MTSATDLVERVVIAMASLAALGATIEDEWTYVQDLEMVWTARLRAVVAERAAVTPGRAAPPDHAGAPAAEIEAAIDGLCAESARITDPHRAIDWLSTLAQATLVALDETAW